MNEKMPTSETLLQHSGWLRALALRLVQDASRADDVVQQAFLQAIRKPPREAKALPAWLARVARNEARQIGRSETARARREQRVGRPRSAQATVDVVERAELHQRVTDAVLSVDEPFRTAVLMRYFDGMTPTEIAEQLGWHPGTARSRLKRGLDQIRVAMDQGSGGDRRQWALPLVALLDSKELAASGVALAPAAVGGAWIVSTKVLGWMVAVLLLVGLGVFAVSRLQGGGQALAPSSGTTTAARSDAIVDGDTPRLEGSPVPREAHESPQPTPAAPAGPAPALARLSFTDGFGNALDAADVERRYRDAGLPLEAILVVESSLVVTEMAEAAVRRFSGSRAGRQVVPWSASERGLDLEVEPGVWRVFVARPGATPLLSDVFNVEEGGAPLAVEIPLPLEVPSVGLRLVATEDETPIAGAYVLPYFEYGDDFAFFEGPPLLSDAGGEVRLPLPGLKLERPRSRHPTWWVVAPGRLAAVPASAFRASDPQVMKVPRTAVIAGMAYRQDGEPAAGLEVVWTKKGRRVSGTVGEDGTFELVGIPTDRSDQQIWLLEDLSTMRIGGAKATVQPGERSEVVIGKSAAASPRGVITGRITAGGHGIEGAMVMVRPEGAGRKERVMSKSNAQGRYGLAVPAGTCQLQIYFGGADDFYVRSTEPTELVPGEEKTLDFDLPGGALLVRLLDDATGEPIAGLAYAAPKERDVAANRFPGFVYRAGSAASAEAGEGILLLALVPGENHRVSAEAEGYAPANQDDVLPSGAGESPVELVLRLRPR